MTVMNSILIALAVIVLYDMLGLAEWVAKIMPK